MWHSITAEQVLSNLETRREGLTEEEAEIRLKLYGKNKLPEPKRRLAFFIFLKQLKNPLVYFLFFATLLAVLLGEVLDALIVGLAILIAAVFGFIQEHKSERAIEELNKYIKDIARVLRNGEEKRIDAELVVAGDIIILQEGYKVPADARLLEVKNLEVNEAALTGESAPAVKKAGVLGELIALAEKANMVWNGTIVTRGYGRAMVVSTGINTEVGKIAKSLAAIEHLPTPLEKKIGSLSRVLSLGIFFILSALFILGIALGKDIREMLLTSIALVAAAVPEGMVVAVTTVLVIGMRRLMKENTLVRNLAAVETLGQATVICADKTGTMTKASMETARIIPKAADIDERKFLWIGMLTSDARVENPRAPFAQWRLTGDPTTRAVLRAALDSGMREDYLRRDNLIIDEQPFESARGYRAVLARDGDEPVMYFMGIPEKLIEESALSNEEKNKLREENTALSRDGLRILGLAKKSLEIGRGDPTKSLRSAAGGAAISEIPDHFQNIDFLGFLALKDPLRASVKDAIAEARQAGIRVMMLTGDNKYTAGAIARELGLRADANHLIDSVEAASFSEEELARKVRDATVFARVTPLDKLRIVQSLQKQNEIVAMTGDGVNDAPALSRADIGIALGSGQAISREAADIVLLDDNFRTIVKAIEEGRGIFDNIRKVVAFLLYDSFFEIFLVGASILMGLPMPILPAQILWVNIVEDTFPAFALALEPKEPGAMKERPRAFGGKILDAELRAIIIVFGFLSALLLFGIYLFLLDRGLALERIRTMIFVGLAIDSLFTVFALKSLRTPVWKIPILNNKYLLLFVGGGILLLALPIYVPFFQSILRTVSLGSKDWVLLLALGFANLILLEAAKIIFIKRRKD